MCDDSRLFFFQLPVALPKLAVPVKTELDAGGAAGVAGPVELPPTNDGGAASAASAPLPAQVSSAAANADDLDATQEFKVRICATFERTLPLFVCARAGV